VTTTPITRSIEKVDAAINEMIEASHTAFMLAQVHGYQYVGPDMIKPIRRLVREVAKVCADTAAINEADIKQAIANSADSRHTQGYIAGRQDAARRIDAALPLELGDDDE